MFDDNSDNENKEKRDRLTQEYHTFVKEILLLTSAGGIVFGFLLSVSTNPPEDFSLVNRITLVVALFSITIAVCLFILPVIYHHSEEALHSLNPALPPLNS